MRRRELARRLEVLEARAETRPASGLDYGMLTEGELRELQAWTLACGDQSMIAWTGTLPEAERGRFRFVHGKLVEGQPRAA